MKFDPATLQTLVIKIGTSLLSGRRAFEGQVMEAMVKELCALKREHDINILIVTSGAVGCGMNTLGITQRPTALPVKQAVASVGQATLMHYYETLFQTYGDGLHTAQVLLSSADLANRQSYLNVRNTINTLFSMKRIVPILNENDSTAVDQLRFGDNDTLAAKIASKINAGLLIILSDIDGLYDRNPSDPEAQHLPEVREITPEIEAFAGGAGTHTGTGGMITKITAAKIAHAAGVPVAIADGHQERIIHRVLAGETRCTVFLPGDNALPHRKRWIAFGRNVMGAMRVDAGAAHAITHLGKSLLPAGVVEVEGDFEAGDAVQIVGPEGRVLARALVNYSSEDLKQIMGHRTGDIVTLIGHKDFDEVAHRDNMVLV
jgi:glutamate 5-kinase